MNSLLGHFYHKIKGSQEDIASASLVYILQASQESRQVVNQLIQTQTGLHFSDLKYQTQTTGKHLERPDISGRDEDGREVLIIEAKFWASLTENQPNGYLKRLNDQSVLLFLVPNLRKRPVFTEVLRRMQEQYSNLMADQDRLKITLGASQKFVLIQSWNEVLQAIKHRLEATQHHALLSDLNQIIGLCATIDRNAFSPITSEDLAPRIPKNINSYYEVVDKVVDALKHKDPTITTKGLIKTPQRYGYHRYFATTHLGMNFSLKLDLWEQYAPTPFWLGIGFSNDQALTGLISFRKQLEQISHTHASSLVPYPKEKGYFLSIHPPLGETEDVVVRELCKKVYQIITSLNTYLEDI